MLLVKKLIYLEINITFKILIFMGIQSRHFAYMAGSQKEETAKA